MPICDRLVLLIAVIHLEAVAGSSNRNGPDLFGNNIAEGRGFKSPKFLQATPTVDEKSEPTLFSLLFHPAVKKRSMDIGLEDSNKGTMKAIDMNEEEDHINQMLDSIEQNEQDQVDAFYSSFDLQNAQLREISKLF